jgi:hypothetical protein
MASNSIIRDHHNLRRNLNLNGKYISNDGGNEGITISNIGEVLLSNQLTLADGTIKIKEQAAAESATDTYGQLWVRSDNPETLIFTTGGGDDIQLTSGTEAIGTIALPADRITEGDAEVSLGTSSGNIVFKDSSNAEWLTFNTTDIQDAGNHAVSEIVGKDDQRLRIRSRGADHDMQLFSERNIELGVIGTHHANMVVEWADLTPTEAEETLSGPFEINQTMNEFADGVDQLADQTAPPAQFRGSTSGTKCQVRYSTDGSGNPTFDAAPVHGGSGYETKIPITGASWNHTAGDTAAQAIITHTEIDSAYGDLVQYMSVRGTGIPPGAYVGSVTDETHFVIHFEGAVVATTATLSGQTIAARDRVVFQDAGDEDTYAILEVEISGSGNIVIGDQSASAHAAGNITPRGILCVDRKVVASGFGVFALGGDLVLGSRGGSLRTQFNALWLATDSTDHGLPGYTDVHAGDRLFAGNSACSRARFRLDGHDSSTSIFQIGSTDLTNWADLADGTVATNWADSGGLTISVAENTGDTVMDCSGDIKFTPEVIGGTFEIEKTYTGTTNNTEVLTAIDYNITGNVASGQTITHKALFIDIEAASDDGAGVGNYIGLDLNVNSDAAGAAGAKNNTGIDVSVTGGDTNYSIITRNGYVGFGELTPDAAVEITDSGTDQLKLSYDSDSYAKIRVAAGSDTTLTVAESGDLTMIVGGHVEFDGCGVGFDKETAIFSTSPIDSDANDSTDVDFRLGNKFELTLTDDISGSSEFINLIFPATSGNFLLVLIQGVADCTVANAGWIAYQSDGSTKATNSAGNPQAEGRVRWAGGSAPTLSTSQYDVDIISIYWDADNQTAFAVASLDF